jgi:hypothetical protein
MSHAVTLAPRSTSWFASTTHWEVHLRTLVHDVRVFDGERTTPNTSVLIDGSLAEALRFGVTTELDMFCLPDNLAKQRLLAAERDDVADLRSAGVLATAPGGHPTQLMTDLDTSEFADALGPFDTVAEGADYLKIVIDDRVVSGSPLPVLAPDTVAALVDAARTAGLLTVAHAITLRDMEVALDACVDCLAHVYGDAGPGERIARRIAEQDVVSTVEAEMSFPFTRSAGAGGAWGRPRTKEE